MVLRDLSFLFKRGLNYLMGLNGSGKSTLIRCISHQIPYEGDIFLGETNLKSLSTKERAQKLAIVYQNLHIPVKIRVFDFVLSGRFPYLGWLGDYTNDDRAIAHDKLEIMGVLDFKDRFLSEISGGELQKVFLARALCQEGNTLLLDEPGQSLDPKSRQELYVMLEELAAGGMDIICATHDFEALDSEQAYIWGLKNGHIECQYPVGMASKALLMEELY